MDGGPIDSRENDLFAFYNYSDSEFFFPETLEEDTDEDDLMFVVASAVIVSALLGITANIVVLILSFGHVKGDFRHFVSNLAVVDILCGFLFGFMGLLNIDDTHKYFSISVMTYSALAFYGSFGIMIWALVPISVSRVCALTNQRLYILIFSHRRSIIICALLDLLPVSILYVICKVDHDVARWLFYFYAIATVVAYLIAFISNYIVFRIVARHIEVVQNLRDQARLLETRQVAVATLAQAFVPLVCQVPAFLTLSSALLLIEPITNGNVIMITQLWLASSPLLDALITIVVIKQYRKECVQYLSSIGNKVLAPHRKINIIFNDQREVFDTSV